MIMKYLNKFLILTLILLFTYQNSLADIAGLSLGDKSNYVVKFYDAGLLYYTGEINGMEATSPKFLHSNKFQAHSPAVKAYSSFLKAEKNIRYNEIKSVIGNNHKLLYHYQAMYHGLLMNLTQEQAQLIKLLPNIKSVNKEPVYEIDLERGPKWINANQIWDGSAVPITGLPNKGEGILIGDIDTGINTDHPFFAEVGPADGYVHINPLGAGNFVGHCIGGNNDGIPPPNAEVQCNNKLIGAWAFDVGDAEAPEDNNGHGSHTAGTVAGNFWDGPFFNPSTQSNVVLPQVSGVAPHANIIAYDVCSSNTCGATTAGIDRAILDGVDVINFSISGGNSPWVDNDRNFLDAVNAGIFVAASAGNTRANNSNPVADTNHLGPWLMTVAASTHDRNGNRELTNFSGGDTSITPSFDGQSNTIGYGPAAIVYAGDFANGDPDPEQCLNPFPADTWTNGEIVLCDRGAIARVTKGANVLAGGAGGFILGNVTGGTDSEVADFHVLPGIHINTAKADEVRTWLSTGAGHMGEIVNSNSGAGTSGDVLAGFSLRGPNLSFDVTKPNITAPGVTIFSSVSNDPNTPMGAAELSTISGTSMSSPHMAGAGALMKAVQPNWTVSEINSAIQMTADKTGRKEDNTTPVDPDDVGSGRVDLALAASAGLVMDETFDNYVNANPNMGGDPKTLNIPSVRNSTCGASCSWTRVFTNKLDVSTNWTVTTSTDGTFALSVVPSSFAVNLTDEIFINGFEAAVRAHIESLQSIVITASGVPMNPTGMSFGEIILTETNGLSPDLHITVSVNQALPFGGTPPPDP